jgi:hypothetical protein
MRWTWALLLLPLLAEAAAAHGGRHAQPPPLVERGIECDCGRVECDRCSADALARGDELLPVERSVTTVRRWGDVARCRTRLVLRARPERRATEAYVRLEPGPLFAVVAGELSNGDETLPARLEPSRDARRKYLFGRRFMNRDPLLVLRRGPGRIDLRVYPVSRDVAATVEVDGYVLADAPSSEAPRLYRTADRYLAILPAARDPHRSTAALWEKAAFWEGGRSLHFLSRAECRERFGTDEAREVPFVHALEAAATGQGAQAASGDMALVALPPDAPLPPFIGPDRVVTLPGGPPPGRREPATVSDPEPPPPPPEPPPPPP